MPRIALSRRELIRGAVGTMVAAGCAGPRSPARAADLPPQTLAPFALTSFSGQPRDRGRAYGRKFKDGIATFLDREIYAAFTGQPASREQMLRYATACLKEVQSFSPALAEEVEGIAEGSGRTAEELVLMSLHEELYHKSPLPMHGHCTAVAVGPPETSDGHALVGQTWDWMQSVAGMSDLVEVRRDDGPSLLAYGFPGLWVGAGLNSAGLALCWTSAALGEGKGTTGPRVGIPSYLLLTHLLYQEDLTAVVAEARRAKHAGWFTFVMADAKGNLLNLEGSPEHLAIEKHTGHLSRVLYGSRQMTKTPPGQAVAFHPRCQKTCDHLAACEGQLDAAWLRERFQNADHGICVGPSTIDMMVYDATAREAWLSRGPDYGSQWKRFTFSAG